MIEPIDKYFVHRYGGLYFALYKGTDTRDLTPVVVYRHVYPFDVAIWVRPEAEWSDGRFKCISTAEAHEIMNGDREALKRAITEKKANK